MYGGYVLFEQSMWYGWLLVKTPTRAKSAQSPFFTWFIFNCQKFICQWAIKADFGIFVLDPFIAGVGAKEYDYLRRHLSYDIVADSLKLFLLV